MKTFKEIAEMHYASEPSNVFDKQYRLNRINALEKLLTEQLTIPDVSNSVFCPNCKTSDMITVDNWCMRCGTVLKKTDC